MSARPRAASRALRLRAAWAWRGARDWAAARRPKSLAGEATLWGAALLAVGLVLLLAVAALGARATGRNLADFAMIDFLQEDVRAAIARCPPADDLCLTQAAQNETGGLWRAPGAAGAVHASFSYAVSGLAGPDGRALSGCARSAPRRAAGFEIFTCALEGGALSYRVAYRGGALVALETESWAAKAARAESRSLAWRSLRAAIIGMALLLGGVIIAALWGLRRTLRRHLNRLGRALDAYRLGARREIAGAYPAEIQAVVDSLNRANSRTERLVARQRRNVQKMAHDLRHQAITIDVAARALEAPDLDARAAEEARAALREEAAALAGLVERYLTLVDWVGPAEGAPPLALAPALEAARRAFSRRLRAAPLEIETVCAPPDLAARIHKTDLQIILSNLAGNAHRHAAGRMILRAEPAPGGAGVRLSVEDDGPGIPEAERARALGWGARLDEGRPGSGFGLAIVAEQMRELYGGALTLETAPLGGLAARVWLPELPSEALDAAPFAAPPPP